MGDRLLIYYRFVFLNSSNLREDKFNIVLYLIQLIFICLINVVTLHYTFDNFTYICMDAV